MRTAIFHHGNKKEGAFTLVELLVVIAIIALLVSILMPSLAKAKELAKQASCSMKHKNLALAHQIYISDNSGNYVTNNEGGSLSWPAKLLPYINDPTNKLGPALRCPSGVKAEKYGNAPGGTWEYIDIHVRKPVIYAKPYPEYGEWKFFSQVSDVVSPSKFMNFADWRCDGTNIWNNYPIGFNVIERKGWINLINNSAVSHLALRHMQSMMAAYLDGHVEAVQNPTWVGNVGDAY